MSLYRTNALIRLKAEQGSGLYYDVPLVLKDESIIIPEPDPESGDTGTTSEYLVLRCDDDDQVYRWSLTDEVELTHYLRISPDQNESPLPRLDLQLSGEWYRVIVKLLDDGDGNLLPSLTTEAGEPWYSLRVNANFGARWIANRMGAEFETSTMGASFAQT